MSSVPVCPSCSLPFEDVPVQFKPCGHLLCTPCKTTFVDMGVGACFVCDTRFDDDFSGPSPSKRSRPATEGHGPAFFQKKVDDMAACIDGLSSQADALAKAFDITSTATTHSLHEYVYGLNRVRAKLDEMEVAARSRAQDHLSGRAALKGQLMHRLEAGKQQAQLFKDMMSAAIASGDVYRMMTLDGAIVPDCSFAANLKPDALCFQPVVDHEAVLACMAASSGEHMYCVDAEETVVTIGNLWHMLHGAGTPLKEVLVDAKTRLGSSVEDLSERDVVLQLLNDESGDLLSNYELKIEMRRPGMCSVSFGLPASFEASKYQLRMYVREVEVLNKTIEVIPAFSGVSGPVLWMPSAQSPYVECAVHADLMYCRMRSGLVNVHTAATGERVSSFTLGPRVVQMVISPEGRLWVLRDSECKLHAFSLQGQELGVLLVPDAFNPKTKVYCFDLVNNVLVVVVDLAKSHHSLVMRAVLNDLALVEDFVVHDVFGPKQICSGIRVHPDGNGFVTVVKDPRHGERRLLRFSFSTDALVYSVLLTQDIHITDFLVHGSVHPEVLVVQFNCMTVFDMDTGSSLRSLRLPLPPDLVCNTSSHVFLLENDPSNVSVVAMH